MCLLVVASRIVPGEPLIVGANRDEVLDRPSTSVTVLDQGPPRVLGGRDELSGGTWLAVNQDGVCAGLTNQPLGDAKDPTKRSRGELPLAAARCATAAEGVEALGAEFDPADYNGAWLLVGDRTSLYFVDFTGAAVGRAELAPGIHVLENRAVDSPRRRWTWCVRPGRRGRCDRAARCGWTATRCDAAFRRVLPTTGSPRGTSGRTRRIACISTGSGPGRRASCAWGRVRVVRRRPGCGWPTGRRARWRTWTCRRCGGRTGSRGLFGSLRSVRPSVADERLVADAVRLVGVDAEALVPVGLVVAEVALAPARPCRPRRRGCGWRCGRGTSGRG